MDLTILTQLSPTFTVLRFRALTWLKLATGIHEWCASGTLHPSLTSSFGKATGYHLASFRLHRRTAWFLAPSPPSVNLSHVPRNESCWICLALTPRNGFFPGFYTSTGHRDRGKYYKDHIENLDRLEIDPRDISTALSSRSDPESARKVPQNHKVPSLLSTPTSFPAISQKSYRL